jgi:hypothetical protein
MASLAAFLDDASKQRFDWGKHDCCQLVRGWVRLQRGFDPAPGWSYSSEMGAALLAHRHGGLIDLIGLLADRAGLPPTGAPTEGDIGVISALTNDGIMPVAAIHGSSGWAFITKGGLSSARVPALAAWRVHG